MNTEQSPATRGRQSSAQRTADNKKFKDAIKELKADFTGITDLAGQVATLQPNTALAATKLDGTSLLFGKRQLTTLKGQFKDKLDDLAKMFADATKKKKRASMPGVGPTSVLDRNSELIAFLNNADLGPAYTVINGACVENGQLRDKLSILLNNGYYGGRMLPILFSVYARYHNLQMPDRPTIYVANDEMRQFLPGTFEILRQENLTKPRTKKADKRDVQEGLAAKTGQKIDFPPFSADLMLFYDFPRIISKNTVDKKSLDPSTRAQIDSQEFKQALGVEYDAVKETLACLKALADAEKRANAPPKARNARRRQTSPATPKGPLPPVVQPRNQGRVSPVAPIGPIAAINNSGRVSPSALTGRVSPINPIGRMSPIPNITDNFQASTRRTIPGMLPNIPSNVIGDQEEEEE